jgi:hypothetical protein
MTELALATEDALSEAIGLRLLAELPAYYHNPLLLRKGGSGYLRSRMESWRQMAQRHMVVILTDLDQLACPLTLRKDWLGKEPPPDNLLLRIAVREVESWVLADHEAVRVLIGRKGTLPPEPDGLPHPKQHLLNLAKTAPRAVRDDLLKETGAISSQGLGYNNRLSAWVRSDWSPERAAQRSPSLRRTRDRLSQLTSRLE